MWLSELEKGMTVWMYGIGDYWEVYSATVLGWSAESVYLVDANGLRFTRRIESVSSERLGPKPRPRNVIPARPS